MLRTGTVTLARGTPAAPAADVVVPDQIGPVRLLHEIGRGGMGVVYLGRHDVLRRDVAVKFLLNAVRDPNDPGFARFVEGVRAAAAVRHPGLTAVHDANVINDVPYVVMEYVDGPTLAGVLAAGGPLPPPVALWLTATVADAIAALHDKDIVHRDIKPANVLVDAAGDVFVTDFGLACLRPPGTSTTGELAGTPAYMAPEMFDGAVSPRSDVYALGVMLFELLTGEPPFVGSLSELRAEHAYRPPPTQRLADRGVGAAVIEVIERALHKNAMFRFKSARYFRRALDEASGGRPPGDAYKAELGRRVAGYLAVTPIPAPRAAPEATTPSYHDRLSELAARKRGETPPALDTPTVPPVAEPAPSVAVPVPLPPPVEPGTQPDILRLKTCPQCGYDLAGLPRRHQCPECAFAYDESMFMVHGWPPDATPTKIVTSAIGWLLVAPVAFAALRWAYIRNLGSVGDELIYFGVGGVWTWWAFRRSRRRKPVIAFFSSIGAELRGRDRPPEVFPWASYSRLRVRRAGRTKWRIRLARSRWPLPVSSKTSRAVMGGPVVNLTIECTRREAAILRREIRRRMAACTAPSPPVS